MSPVRRVKPPAPKPLHQQLAEFDAELAPGDGDVEVPAAVWAELMRRAKVERESHEDDPARQMLSEFCASLAHVLYVPASSPTSVLLDEVRAVFEERDALSRKRGTFAEGLGEVRVEAFGADGHSPDRVRLIVRHDGTMLALDEAAQLATQLADAHAELTRAVPPPKKQRKPRAAKAYCAKCNDTTKHDGNDECMKCAARELFDAQQKAEAKTKTPLEAAIDDASGGAP